MRARGLQRRATARYWGRHAGLVEIDQVETAALPAQHVLGRRVEWRAIDGDADRRQRGLGRCHVLGGCQADGVAEALQGPAMRQDGLAGGQAGGGDPLGDDQRALAGIRHAALRVRGGAPAAAEAEIGDARVALALCLRPALQQAFSLRQQECQHALLVAFQAQAGYSVGNGLFHGLVERRGRLDDPGGSGQFPAIALEPDLDDVAVHWGQSTWDQQVEAMAAITFASPGQVNAEAVGQQAGNQRTVVVEIEDERCVGIVGVPHPALDTLTRDYAQFTLWQGGHRRQPRC